MTRESKRAEMVNFVFTLRSARLWVFFNVFFGFLRDQKGWRGTCVIQWSVHSLYMKKPSHIAKGKELTKSVRFEKKEKNTAEYFHAILV